VPVKHYRLEDLLAEMDRLGSHNQPESVDDAYSRGEITLDDILRRKPDCGSP
jgi:hypothetical protein